MAKGAYYKIQPNNDLFKLNANTDSFMLHSTMNNRIFRWNSKSAYIIWLITIRE